MLAHNNNNLSAPAIIAADPNAMVKGNINSAPDVISKKFINPASQGDSNT
jgi:hypothetical protein